MVNKQVLLTLTIAAAFVIAVPLLARTENVRLSFRENSNSLASGSVSKATAASLDDEPQIVSLEVTPNGFEPRETTARGGKFLILLQNRTGRRDLSFFLIRENQERLAESEPQKRDWKAHVQLGPGTYIVGETNHPEWQSVIRVTN